MGKKTKELQDKYDELSIKAKELEILLEESKKEELDLLKKIKEDIKNLEEDNNLFCGVVLTKEDIINIFKLFLEKEDNVKIPFNLYFNN